MLVFDKFVLLINILPYFLLEESYTLIPNVSLKVFWGKVILLAAINVSNFCEDSYNQISTILLSFLLLIALLLMDVLVKTPL